MPTPQLERGSPAEKAAAYFKRHPNERLGRADLARIAGVPIDRASEAVAPAVTLALVKVMQGPSETRLWTGGRLLSLWAAPAQHKGAAAPADLAPTKTPAPRGGRVTSLPPLDPAKLTLRHDLPLPDRSVANRGRTKYSNLFAGLREVGASYTGIDIAYRGALSAAAAKTNQLSPAADGSQLVVRVLADGTLGVWRAPAGKARQRPGGPGKAAAA